MPLASAFARVLAVFAAPVAVVRALRLVVRALGLDAVRLRVAALFLAAVLRCVGVWLAMVILLAGPFETKDIRSNDLRIYTPEHAFVTPPRIRLWNAGLDARGQAAARCCSTRATHSSGCST